MKTSLFELSFILVQLLFLVLFLTNTSKADLKLTPCLGNSVCGILQANSKGVTKVPYCNCSLAECPMTWDPYDGKSLTQSTSDQYKFCDSAPSQLGLCDLEDLHQPSYTSYQYFDKFTREKKLLNDEIYCLCPEGYNYLDTRYVFYQRAEYDVVQINSYCLPLPKCTEDEICKEITDMPGEFLVNPICQCPGQMSCPSVAPKNVEVMVYDKQTVVYNVKCQNTDPNEFKNRYTSLLTYAQLLTIPPQSRTRRTTRKKFN